QYIYSAPGRLVHTLLHVTLHVWQPIHLSKFMTMPNCALIFKPIHLISIHFSYRYLFITLVAGRSIVIEAVTELCITANHLCRFNMDTCWAIECAAACF